MKKILYILAITLLLGSCQDKDLFYDEPGNGEGVEIAGDALVLNMVLDVDFSTRAAGDGGAIIPTEADNRYVKDKEDWIDAQDKLRVFFFTKEGEFLFGAIDRTVNAAHSADVNSKLWQVRIPMNIIVDRQGNEYDVEAIKNYLKNNEFKVAVLANWPNRGERVKPGEYDDSDESGSFHENPASELKGEPNWGLKNSVLYDESKYTAAERNKIGAKDVKNINDLHHLFDETNNYVTKGDVYMPFMGQVTRDGSTYWASGQPTDWIRMRNIQEGWHSPKGSWKFTNGQTISSEVSEFDTQETAEAWIRQNWNPENTLNEEKKIYRHYQHLWYVWNFHAAFKTGKEAGTNNQNTGLQSVRDLADANYADNWGWNSGVAVTKNNPWGAEWYARNGKDLYSWMNRTSVLPKFTTAVGSADNKPYFEYKTHSTQGKKAEVSVGNTTYYGINLPAQTVKKMDENSAGCIRIQARTSGNVRVKFGSLDGKTATISVQKNTSNGKDFSTTSMTPVDFEESGNPYYYMSVGDDSYPVYIFAKTSNTVIYSIEFNRGKYLYDTDREGIMPNDEHGIPMYGVQNYQPIPNWEDGSTYRLSDDDGAEDIYLIRSIAKVVFYIKKEFGTPQHVYMKSLNRSAHCEPMDVETPTSTLWKEKHEDDNCEFFLVQKYGAAYRTADSGIPAYYQWFSWYYGAWKNASWNVPGYTVNAQTGKWTPTGSITGWNYNNKITTLPSNNNSGQSMGGEYPHLFNPYLNRSDFCHFIYAGSSDDGQYNVYVLYVPEKNIDDPSTHGVPNKTPKVPHIEYRFAPTTSTNKPLYSNTEFNLDDNDCFRVYFTNYGTMNSAKYPINSTIKNQSSGTYDSYEMSEDNLNKHWPIMRNHIYEFFVGGQGPEAPEVHVKVSDWKHEKVIVEW